MTTKSVKVPPVSTPILEVDARDILDVLRGNSFKVRYSALCVALPDQGLKVGANRVESMNGDLALPGEVGVGGRRVGNSLDPEEDLRALFIVGVDLERGAFSCIDAKRGFAPPAGFNN